LLLALCIGTIRPVAAGETAEAFLDIQMQQGLLVVTPWVRVTRPGEYRYVLRSRVLGSSGGSSASSSGSLVLPDRLVRLNATASHRLRGPAERVRFSLHVFQGARLVAEDTISFPE
jgi:hypothetical protein